MKYPSTSQVPIADAKVVLDTLVGERRQALRDAGLRPPEDDRPWGLALSGGGIRSATFCLGLVVSLAKAGLFHRFDLMSTVSGGGYTGAMIGALANQAKDAQKLEAQLCKSGIGDGHASRSISWLRTHGRYLMPRGAKDLLGMAFGYGCSLFRLHRELALLGILLGCALGLLDIAAWAIADDLLGRSEGSASALMAWELTASLPPIVVVGMIVLLLDSMLRRGRAAGKQRVRAALGIVVIGAIVGLAFRDSIRAFHRGRCSGRLVDPCPTCADSSADRQ